VVGDLTFFKKEESFGNWKLNFEFCPMENFETRWQSVEKLLEERFGKLPDMEAILFLIGLNELGKISWTQKWSKEQKQDLMHVAVCSLLSKKGFYELEGKDEEGWPHFKNLIPIEANGLKEQEMLLKECMIEYFEQ
jgi:hypothetical protein